MLINFHIFNYFFRAIKHLLLIFKVSAFYEFVKCLKCPWAPPVRWPNGLSLTRAAPTGSVGLSRSLPLPSRETLALSSPATLWSPAPSPLYSGHLRPSPPVRSVAIERPHDGAPIGPRRSVFHRRHRSPPTPLRHGRGDSWCFVARRRSRRRGVAVCLAVVALEPLRLANAWLGHGLALPWPGCAAVPPRWRRGALLQVCRLLLSCLLYPFSFLWMPWHPPCCASAAAPLCLAPCLPWCCLDVLIAAAFLRHYSSCCARATVVRMLLLCCCH
jgi:hypothetical protein